MADFSSKALTRGNTCVISDTISDANVRETSGCSVKSQTQHDAVTASGVGTARGRIRIARLGDLEMADAPTLEGAMSRLDSAVSGLERAVEKRVSADQTLGGLQNQIQRLGEDRSQLAGTLDSQKAHSNTLEEANREVSRRLVSAMESIRNILDDHGG